MFKSSEPDEFISSASSSQSQAILIDDLSHLQATTRVEFMTMVVKQEFVVKNSRPKEVKLSPNSFELNYGHKFIDPVFSIVGLNDSVAHERDLAVIEMMEARMLAEHDERMEASS